MLSKKKPVFIIGAFGGASKVVIDLLQEKVPDSINDLQNDPGYQKMFNYFNSVIRKNEAPIDYDSLISLFHSIDTKGLNNGLTEEEN